MVIAKWQNSIRERYFTEEDLHLLILVIYMLIIRILFMRIISSDGDNIYYWVSAKNLLHGLPYDYYHHIPARYGIMIPVIISQLLFGTHPLVYYISPFIFSIIQLIILYKLSLKSFGRSVAILSSILLIHFPQMVVKSGYEILPEIFESTYIVIGVYFIVKYLSSGKESLWSIVWASFAFFLAYESKETSIYYLPVLFISLWYFKKSAKGMFLFAGILLGLFITEQCLYHFVAGIPLGRVDILLQTHLNQEFPTITSFWGLFDRFFVLPFYWKYSILLTVIIGTFLLFSKNIAIKLPAILTLFFIAAMTFSIKSMDPVTPAFPFRGRYLSSMIPMMMLIISYGVIRVSQMIVNIIPRLNILERLTKKRNSACYLGICLITLCIIIAVVNELLKISPIQNNAIIQAIQYHRTTNESFRNGIPIVVYHSNDSSKSKEWEKLLLYYKLNSEGVSNPEKEAGLNRPLDDYLQQFKPYYKDILLLQDIYLDDYTSLHRNINKTHGLTIFFNIKTVHRGDSVISFILRNDYMNFRDKNKIGLKNEEKVIVTSDNPFSLVEKRAADICK